jgi:hypothetical protein
VSNNGLRVLAGLTALTDLNLWGCVQVSDDGLRALTGLTALISLGDSVPDASTRRTLDTGGCT